MTSRRQFIVNCSFGSSALALGLTTQPAFAQAMVAETDANAIALGYKAVATQVDKAKFPKYVAGHMCSNCSLFQGKPGDKAGGCALFGAKQVAGPGWCNAWAKKG